MKTEEKVRMLKIELKGLLGGRESQWEREERKRKEKKRKEKKRDEEDRYADNVARYGKHGKHRKHKHGRREDNYSDSDSDSDYSDSD